MNRKPIAVIVCVALLGFAFIAAPQSCDWGLSAYVLTGIAVIVFLFALPFIRAVPGSRRFGAAIGYSTLGTATWVAGFFMANFTILCRLF